MQEEHRRVIQNNFLSLVEQTDLEEMVSVLYEKGVFSEAMVEPYRDTNKDVRARKRQLYRDIERRGPAAFSLLLESLQEMGHWELLRSLDPQSLPPRRDILKPGPGSSSQPSHSTFVSLSKKDKEPPKPAEIQPSTRAIPVPPKAPYPLDFYRPDEESSEIPHFHVKKSTKFHDPSDTKVYRTRSRHRGVLIAFSFIDFKHNIEPDRRGADVDCKNLKYLFSEIGFRTLFYNNLKKQETEDTLTKLKSITYFEAAECVFVVFSSHGYERTRTTDIDMRCSDGQLLSVRSVIDQFNNKTFPQLDGVPKVFIFQTCRGDSSEHMWGPPRHLAAPAETDGRPSPPRAAPLTHDARAPARAARAAPLTHDARAPLEPKRLYSDILIAHSTLPGFVSQRDPEKGSWYIQALCEVFAAQAHDHHVKQLFEMVDDRMKEKFQPQTSSVDSWGFNGKLYLHPGLFDDAPETPGESERDRTPHTAGDHPPETPGESERDRTPHTAGDHPPETLSDHGHIAHTARDHPPSHNSQELATEKVIGEDVDLVVLLIARTPPDQASMLCSTICHNCNGTNSIVMLEDNDADDDGGDDVTDTQTDNNNSTDEENEEKANAEEPLAGPSRPKRRRVIK